MAGGHAKGAGYINRRNLLTLCLLLSLRYLKPFDSVITFNDILKKSKNCTTVDEVKGIINDTVRKAFDSEITLNDILMISPNCTTVVEVMEYDHDTVIMVS